MKPTITRITVACLTFVLGISTAALFIERKSAESLPATDRAIYDVSYSELAATPQEYVGKVVRVKALMFGWHLDDPRLMDEGLSSVRADHGLIGYDFASAAVGTARLEEAFGPRDCPLQKATGCGRALATVVGEFVEIEQRPNKYGKPVSDFYDFWITIDRLEDIEPCPNLWFHGPSVSPPNKGMNRTRK